MKISAHEEGCGMVVLVSKSFLNEFQYNLLIWNMFWAIFKGGKLYVLNLIFVHIVSKKTKIEDHNVTFDGLWLDQRKSFSKATFEPTLYIRINSYLERSYYFYYINKHINSEDIQMKLSYHHFLYILVIS